MYKAKIEKAEALLDLQPTGTVPHSVILPWIVQALQFLLVEYILQHRCNK